LALLDDSEKVQILHSHSLFRFTAVRKVCSRTTSSATRRPVPVCPRIHRVSQAGHWLLLTAEHVMEKVCPDPVSLSPHSLPTTAARLRRIFSDPLRPRLKGFSTQM